MSGASFVRLETVGRDLVYALRSMRRTPVFAVTAVITLALGIGGNTAMFSVLRAVLLKPLSYSDPDRLVRLPDGTPGRYEEMLPAAQSFTGISVYAIGTESLTLSGGTEPESIRGARVSANFLQILGVEPAVGRSFLAAEDAPGGPPAALISTALWRRRFNADPRVTERTISLDAKTYPIVGVLPDRFEFPFIVDVWLARPQEWPPIPPLSRIRSPFLSGFARLKPGVTLEQARAEQNVLYRQYAAGHPEMLDAKPGTVVRIERLKDRLVSTVREMIWMLTGAVGFVLLIACANVASLLMARATSRSREFAVRAALGAARGQLIAQLLAESLVLALVSGALGILLARWALSAVKLVDALALPRAGEIRLDGAVLIFSVLLSIATGILFGLLPSFRASRPDLAETLRAAGRGQTGARRSFLGVQTRGWLVAGEIGLSTVLLLGAALLIESLVRLGGVNPGFQPSHLLTMKIALPPVRYDSVDKRAAFYEDLVRRVESIPGVRGAALALTLPMTGFAGTPVQPFDQPPAKLNERQIGIIQSVTPGYFRTLGIPLRRGREFTDRDRAATPRVVVIDEALARRFWPAYPAGLDPIGQRLRIGINPNPIEIVGIAAEVHQAGLGSTQWPEMYMPVAQSPPQSIALAVRTTGEPMSFVNSVRTQVLALDRDQPVTAVQSMEQIIEASEGQRRSILWLLGTFAGVAFLLAIVGIYGVVAYSVVQRTQEMGIRRALGAQQSDISSLVLKESFVLVVVGVAAGSAAALGLTKVMKTLLFQVSPTDPAVFAMVATVFIAVALAASFIPARRAAAIDPMIALRIG